MCAKSFGFTSSQLILLFFSSQELKVVLYPATNISRYELLPRLSLHGSLGDYVKNDIQCKTLSNTEQRNFNTQGFKAGFKMSLKYVNRIYHSRINISYEELFELLTLKIESLISGLPLTENVIPNILMPITKIFMKSSRLETPRKTLLRNLHGQSIIYLILSWSSLQIIGS